MKTHVGDKLKIVAHFKRLHNQHILGVEIDIRKFKTAIALGDGFRHAFDPVEHLFAGVSHARRGRPRAVAVDIILQLFDFRLLAVIFVLVLLVENFALDQKLIVIAGEFRNSAVLDADDHLRHVI